LHGGDQTAADALHDEELLGDDGAADQAGHLQCDAGDERQARCPQRVAPQHPVGGDALGTSEVDEVALQREDHVGAQ
jgi:hypothetical protein